MTWRRLAAVAIATAALVVGAGRFADRQRAAEPPPTAVRGDAPSYAPPTLAGVPNEAAIVDRFWVPGLDTGFTPQGLAIADGALLLSGYRSSERGRNRGPCRVYRLDPAAGRRTAEFDVPAPCGHAGGLAVAADGMLYVADTHDLFEVPVDAAFATAPPPRHIPLGPGLVGALAVSGNDAIWLGSYRQDGPGRLYQFATAELARWPAGAPLTVEAAPGSLAIPSYAQGAAIDRDGKLWVARSNTRWGELQRVDPATGAIERRYDAPPGIEGIVFDASGRLWAVSEAGAWHFYGDAFRRLVTPFYPLVFEIDPAKLE